MYWWSVFMYIYLYFHICIHMRIWIFLYIVFYDVVFVYVYALLLAQLYFNFRQDLALEIWWHARLRRPGATRQLRCHVGEVCLKRSPMIPIIWLCSESYTRTHSFTASQFFASDRSQICHYMIMYDLGVLLFLSGGSSPLSKRLSHFVVWSFTDIKPSAASTRLMRTITHVLSHWLHV